MNRVVPALCFSAVLLNSAAVDHTYQRVALDSNQRVVLRDASGKVLMPAAEKGQVSCSKPAISADRKIAGWQIDYENCCTSYPVPLKLVLFRDGKVIQRLGDGLMIYQWTFRKGGRQVAMETGTVHFMRGRHMILFDTQTGAKIKEWNGEEDEAPPEWGRVLNNK